MKIQMAERLNRQQFYKRTKTEIMWIIHNLVAHPVSEVTYWLGFIFPRVRSFGEWLHDATVPDHDPGTGRG